MTQDIYMITIDFCFRKMVSYQL